MANRHRLCSGTRIAPSGDSDRQLTVPSAEVAGLLGGVAGPNPPPPLCAPTPGMLWKGKDLGGGPRSG